MSANFDSNVNALFTKMESFITTKTVVGEPIFIGGVILLPLVDVNFGMAAGSVDSDKEKDKNEVGGGGIGAKISPSAVIVVQNGNVQLVNVKNQESVNKLIDLVPGVLSKLNLGGLFGKDDAKTEADDASETFTEEKI